MFSKDRALQLDACLASFGRQVEDAEAAKLLVLYSASSSRLEGQYLEVAREYGRRADFIREQDFQRQVVSLVGTADDASAQSQLPRFLRRPVPPALPREDPEGGADCVLFLVDDALFVRPLRLATARAALHTHPEAMGFSLRLGSNTTHCYVLDREQRVPSFVAIEDGILKYEWKKADGDFGYPLEISSSLYRRTTIAGLIAALEFADPNTLESQLALQARKISRRHPFMLCPDLSVAFSAPINRVQEVYENRTGTSPDWSTARLADSFDQGLRINVAALDGFVPSACHQEVELALEPRTGQQPKG